VGFTSFGLPAGRAGMGRGWPRYGWRRRWRLPLFRAIMVLRCGQVAVGLDSCQAARVWLRPSVMSLWRPPRSACHSGRRSRWMPGTRQPTAMTSGIRTSNRRFRLMSSCSLLSPLLMSTQLVDNPPTGTDTGQSRYPAQPNGAHPVVAHVRPGQRTRLRHRLKVDGLDGHGGLRR